MAKPMNIMSYNCRGLNDFKKGYLRSLLMRCDVLFIQEHWLSDEQLPILNALSTTHSSMGVCGFGSNDVLSGRPYGGCAIFWRQGMCNDVTFVQIDSRRVCGICCTFSFGKVLFLNSYMPYECDDASRTEFNNQLGIIEDVLQNYGDCHVVLGGDFNVDVNRVCANTSALQEFCGALNLFFDVRHKSYKIDYTYHFAMKVFYSLDHFIMSEELFTESVCDIHALHEVDNVSDHEPVCLSLDVEYLADNMKARSFEPKIAWHKASPDNLSAYRNMLRDQLASLHIPYSAVTCHDVFCKDPSHISALTEYINDMSNGCLLAAKHTVPVTSLRATRGHIPGWSEDIEPRRRQSMFWHDIWVDCGRPRSGYVADIMRKTRSAYHYAIRNARRHERDKVNQRFAEAVVDNNSRDFWGEVKRIRSSGTSCSSCVDGLACSKDIADLFARQYQDLYTSVPYDQAEMACIYGEIESSITVFDQNCLVTVAEVIEAIHKLKPGKSDGYAGLSSDYFLQACDELFVHISLLFSSLLVHSCVPAVMALSTVIPIPKGKHCNITSSANYRGISLISVFNKLFDLILLSRYYCELCSCDLQFGFKPKRSTDMCTMILKESISYYINNNSHVYCTFLDASKAFDRVEYSKLFRLLMKRKLPAVVLRLLCTMYVIHGTRVQWNGVYSEVFEVLNGVKQGGIISPIMFCVYIDNLLLLLAKSEVGCFIGKWFVGALAYADDIVLLAPSASAMRRMLNSCDSFAKQYNIIFNVSKSKCMHFSPKGRPSCCSHRKPVFCINGGPVDYVDEWLHLGHAISSNLDDKSDIARGRSVLVRQINNVLCFFKNLNHVTKMRLLTSYCFSLYGCVLWDITHSDLELVCSTWRSGVRRVWGLPNRTHCALIPLISGRLPLYDEIIKRMLSFIRKCLMSDNELVNFVARYAVWHGRMMSPLGRNTFHCCQRYGAALDALWSVTPACIFKAVRSRCDSQVCTARMILELVFIRSGDFIFSDSRDSMSESEVESLIQFLSTS